MRHVYSIAMLGRWAELADAARRLLPMIPQPLDFIAVMRLRRLIHSRDTLPRHTSLQPQSIYFRFAQASSFDFSISAEDDVIA